MLLEIDQSHLRWMTVRSAPVIDGGLSCVVNRRTDQFMANAVAAAAAFHVRIRVSRSASM